MTLMRAQRDPDPFQSLKASILDDWFAAPIGGWKSPLWVETQWAPNKCAVDLKENQLDLAFSVQGFEPDDVQINCYQDKITIKAKVDRNKKDGDVTSQFLMDVEETVKLTPEFDGKLAEATIKNGILKITIPRGEESKPKLLKPKYE